MDLQIILKLRKHLNNNLKDYKIIAAGLKNKNNFDNKNQI